MKIGVGAFFDAVEEGHQTEKVVVVWCASFCIIFCIFVGITHVNDFTRKPVRGHCSARKSHGEHSVLPPVGYLRITPGFRSEA